MLSFHACLANTPDPKEIRSVYVWGAILIGVVLVSYFVYSYFKRWMNDTGSSNDQGFSLSDLRKLRDQGKISPEEYEQTRSKIVAATKRMTSDVPDLRARPKPSPGRETNDPPV